MCDFVERTRDRNAFLACTYHDLMLMKGPDGPLPAWSVPISPRAAADIDRLSVQLERVPAVTVYPARVDDAAEQAKRARMWDGVTFSLSGFVRDATGHVEGLRGYLGSYFRMRDTAGYLERELAAIGDDAYSLDVLPARRAVLDAFVSPAACLSQGGGVDAAMGGSTIVMFAHNGTYYMLLGRRAPTLDRAGLYHTIPSFMYQPEGQGPSVPPLLRRISHTIYREYLEELFSIRMGEDPADIYANPNLKYAKNLIDEGAAELRATGLITNLVDHRLEICSHLIFHDPAWYARQRDTAVAARYGLVPIRADAEIGRDSVTVRPIEDDAWADILGIGKAMPMAVATVVLGVRSAFSSMGRAEPRWLRTYDSSVCKR